ncbi:uncharacterized protein [Triticum aestivum]|uniref:DUF4378 domain-containing protein n=2 Tax=Triticum TaxID=4564 RepID=A0A9R1RB85_TRITD|nr:uncharacterized protein LOC123190023 [Triticum aestivum]VAH35031.1 unnamed protein product [Triticum turgidum subsp. durum]
MELEGRPALMLKEWLELEFTAELSRDGFGCYPRHLVAELRTTRRNGDVIARVSAAVRAALFRPPGTGREGEVALAGNSPRRLRMGFWKKRRGEEAVDRRAPSCSPSTTAGGRRDGSSPATLPRRRNPERGQSVGAGAAGRRSNETKVAGLEATPHLEQEQERKQRLSPVSVMDFLSQDEDDDGNEDENGDGDGVDGDDETASPTFQQSIANIRRASQELLQKIRQFEQLGDLDVSDVDDATTTTEDVSYNMLETDSIEDGDDASAQGILDLLEASSSGSSHCFQKLLVDFFRGDKTPRNLGRGKVLLETAQAWLDGQNCSLRPIWTVVKMEVASIEQWRCLREDEKNLLAADLENDIISSLIGELADELY